MIDLSMEAMASIYIEAGITIVAGSLPAFALCEQ